MRSAAARRTASPPSGRLLPARTFLPVTYRRAGTVMAVRSTLPPSRSATMSRAARRYLSPLRYPGGKARMASALGDLFDRQVSMLDIEVWIEPFAGGAGAGLTLL